MVHYEIVVQCPILLDQSVYTWGSWLIISNNKLLCQMQIDLWREDPALCLRSWIILGGVATRTCRSGDLGDLMLFFSWYVTTSNWYVIVYSLCPYCICYLIQFVAWSAHMVQVGHGWNVVWHHLNSFSSYMDNEYCQCYKNSHISRWFEFASNCTVKKSLIFFVI